MSLRDKKIQVILAHIDPHECFQEALVALKGLDMPEEALLDFMENNKYDERDRHNEREKLSQYRRAITLKQAQEQDRHCKGYPTLEQLWKDTGRSLLELDGLAHDIDDEDVEYHAGTTSTKKHVPKPNMQTLYTKPSAPLLELPTDLSSLDPDTQFKLHMEALFHKTERVFCAISVYQGMGLLRDTAIEQGVGLAFININSCSGENSDENVLSYRHTLIECDDTPDISKQYSMLISSGLPVTVVVDSGAKSLHAAIRVDANGPEQYKERVRIVRAYCSSLGIEYDKSTGDPSRYTRCAGSDRVLEKDVDWRNRYIGETYQQSLISLYPNGRISFIEWYWDTAEELVNYTKQKLLTQESK